jgi:beta-lactam-binding protein with PASTA domain
VRTCASCGTENADERDFCESCGEYLRWDPTQYIQAVPESAVVVAGATDAATAEDPGADATAERPEAAPDAGAPAGDGEATEEIGPPAEAPDDAPEAVGDAAPPAVGPGGTLRGTLIASTDLPGAAATDDAGNGVAPHPTLEQETVLLALRLPTADTATPGEVRTTVEAGGQTFLRALVRNQSGIVDNYDLTVEGLPAGWARVEPSTVYLVPFGAPGGAYEEDVGVVLSPPRSPVALARDWPVHLVARSRARGVEVARAAATLTIQPYLELQSELRPQRASGRRGARYAVAVRNQANAPAEVLLSAIDDEQLLDFAFEEERIVAAPGRRGGSRFTVHPRRQIWFGRPVEHRFEVIPRSLAAPAPEPPVGAFLRQKPWIPYWALLLIPLVIAGVIALIQLWPSDAEAVTVPDVTEAPDLLTAQTMLEQAGLTLGERFPKPSQDEEPGAIIGQTPAPGERVDEGSAVAINVAEGTGLPSIEVPRVIGMTQRSAVAALKERGLQVGRLLSEPAAPTAKIAFQAPEAGEKAREGDPVDIDFKPNPSGAAPAVAGMAAAAAAADLAGKGIPSVTKYRLSEDVAPGELIEQIPAAGAEVPEGRPVTLVVSAGNPRIAFDDGKDVLTMGATGGTPLDRAAASGDVETQPSWSPDGSLIAYRRTSAGTANPLLPSSPARIWVVSPADAMADPITDEGFDDRRPAFAPGGDVVAFVSNRPDGGRDFDLCFQRMDAASLAPACVRSPDLSVSRPAWSPDGRAILVDSERVGGDRSELAMYVSRRAGSDRPADWSLRAAIAPRVHASRPGDQVRTVAWSPDGKLVAFSANWGGGVFRLFIASVGDGYRIGKPVAVGRIAACEVSWSRAELGQVVISQRDPVTCEGPGQILRVDPLEPSQPTVLSRIGAGNPVWSPAAATS